MRTTIFSSRPILSILAGLTLAATACTGIRGEGDLLTENRNHSGFHAVEISVPGHVGIPTPFGKCAYKPRKPSCPTSKPRSSTAN